MTHTVMARFVYLKTNAIAGMEMYKNDSVSNYSLIKQVLRFYDKKTIVQFDDQQWKIEAKVICYQNSTIDFYLVSQAKDFQAYVDNILHFK